MNNPFTEMSIITKKEYEDLLKDSRLLACLHMSGVDNWEGYDNAIELMNNPNE